VTVFHLSLKNRAELPYGGLAFLLIKADGESNAECALQTKYQSLTYD
jgi:hypothetical protein